MPYDPGSAHLRFFRWVKSPGGIADWGTWFSVHLRIYSEADLVDVLGRLGLAVEQVPEGTPRDGPFVAPGGRPIYRIDPASSIRQLGDVRIAGAEVTVWASLRGLTIEVRDAWESWDASEQAAAGARAIEALLAPLADRVVQPPFRHA